MRHNMKKRVVVALGGNALGNSLPEQKIAEADIDKYFNQYCYE